MPLSPPAPPADALLDATGLAVLVFDAGLRLEHATPRAAAVLGVGPDDVGRTAAELSARTGLEDLSADVARAAPAEREVETADGPAARRVAAAGARVVVTFADRSAQRAAERAAAEAEGRRLTAVEAARVGDWAVDVVTGAGAWSPRALEMMRLPPDATPTLADHDALVHPDDLPGVRKAVQAARDPAGDGQYEAAFRFRFPDGDVRWFESRGRAVFDAPGRPATRLLGAMVDVTAHKRAEAALHEANARLRLANERFRLAEAAAAGWVYDWDPRTGTVERSEGFERVLGYAPGEIPQTAAAWQALVHPDDVAGLPADLGERAVGGPDTVTFAYRVRAADGRYRHVLDHGLRLRGHGGEVLRVVGSTTDVTERLDAAAALRASEARYRDLVEAATAFAVLTLDPDGRITSWGPGAEAITGWTAAEAVGQPGAILFTPEDRAAGVPETEMATARLAGQAADERPHVRRDGSRFWASGVLAARAADDGALRGYVKIFRDATDQRRAEQALAEREAQFRRAIVAASVPVMLHADDGEILAVSDGLVAATGYPRESLGRMSDWLERAYPGRAAEVAEVIADSFRKSRAITGTVLTVRVASGADRLWEFSAGVPETLPDGRCYYVCFAVDLTDHARAEAEVRALNATLERRVDERTQEVRYLAARLTVAEQAERHRIAQVLHDDLQQQLYGLAMLLGVLRRGGDGALAAEADRIVQQAITTSRTLVSELSPSVLQAARLEDVLRWLADETRARHGLEVGVAVEGEPDVPDAALRILLVQALRELLFNVVKHAGVGAARVRAWADGADVKVAVEDDGQGFPDAEARSGFGLTSVRERLTLVGGSLDLDSAPGRGTRATLCVPAGAAFRDSPEPSGPGSGVPL